MFGRIAAFELRYQLRQPAFWVSFLSFFLLTFLSMVIDNVQIGSGGGTHANSPFAVVQTMLIMSLIGMFIPVSIIPGTVLRDPESGMAGIVYSYPLRPLPFLLGRFTGAYIAVILGFLGAPLGTALGSFMWWLDPETLGPFRPGDYLYALGVMVMPNLLVTSGLFFAVAAATRSQFAVYTSLIALLVLWVTSRQLIDGPETQTLEAMLDPFGIVASGQVMRYWTVFERNGMLVPFDGLLLWNRLLWLGIAVVLVGVALALFRFKTQPRSERRRRRLAEAAEAAPAAPALRPPVTSRATPGSAAWRQLAARTRLEAVGVMKSPGFLVILALGVFNTVGALTGMDRLYGTEVYPVTRVVANLIMGSFSIVPLIVLVYYSAELVWRDRQQKTHEIVTACPVPGWVFVLSKLTAMTVVVAALFTVATLVGIVSQLLRGYTAIELELYLGQLFFFFGVPLMFIGVLSILVQALSPNKFVGMLLVVGFFLLTIVAAQMGLSDNLLIYASTPSVPLSDMNGWGHFAKAALWFMLYWGFAAGLLMVLAHRLWPGAVPAPLGQRLKGLGRGWTIGSGALAAACLVGFVATGGWIAYNTHVLNEVVSNDAELDRRAEFERTYRQYEAVPQPIITDVKVDIDLYPEIRRYEARGRYVLENRTGQPLGEVHVLYSPDVDVVAQAIPGARTTHEDRDFNYFIFALDTPLPPGGTLDLSFTTRQENPGFKNDGDVTSILYNGSFLNNMEVAPFIGFSRDMLLKDRNERRKRGLEPLDRMAKLEDEAARRHNYLRQDSHWVGFETTVSTSPDQIAIAPGYLQREWMENGRRYFHYRMDAPILNFYSWLSARYTVATDKWKDVDLSVYYHAPHAYNVPRMLDAMKKSLDYFTVAFSPYQHRQLRILEFPAYQSFAQSFPNTVPYSESIGFIADNRDPEDIDYVFYVTAHEVAHQWWAHQVMGGDVQGSTLLSESLSQYSALMVMEKEYGPDKIRRFLKYELDRYLRGRGSEDREELPIYRVENQQYIHYRKGSLVMYALRDQIGEDVVNRALARLIKETGYRSDPYPTSLDLLRILREEAGPEHQQLITDLFERIVLYDLKVASHTVERTEDGRFKVRLTLAAGKAEADGEGRETPLPLDDRIDIGVFAKDPADPAFSAADVIYLQKHRIDSADPVIELVVDHEPAAVGVDPYNKLIDRNSDDNLARHAPAATLPAGGGGGAQPVSR
ncbi:M1 family aminopeptidase [Rhodocista pekingensis]|uniref:M1 family aminopeptidase n=1 Tax=Rhodocista pekingensis TaxID=201185 RepID=A0ABW2KV39_9PROT